MPARVEVTIDEVVLRSVAPERAREVVAALEADLARCAQESLAALPNPRLRGDRAESSRRARGTAAGRVDDGGSLGASLAAVVWREVVGTVAPVKGSDGGAGTGRAR